MCCGCKLRMQIAKVLILPVNSAYISRCRRFGRNLTVFHGVSNFIGNNLPSHFSVQWNRIREQQSQGLFLLTHMFETLQHQTLHNALSGIFRIGTYTGNKSNRINSAVNIHFQRVYGNLRNQRIVIKTPQYIGALQNWKLRLLDFIAAPSINRKVLFRDLKGIAQK